MAKLTKEDRKRLIHNYMRRSSWARGLRKKRIRQQVLHSVVRLIIIGVLLFLAGTFGVIPCPIWLRVILYIFAALELITIVARLQMAINWGYQESILRMIDIGSWHPEKILRDLENMPRYAESLHGLYMSERHLFFSCDLFDVALYREDLVWAYPD